MNGANLRGIATVSRVLIWIFVGVALLNALTSAGWLASYYSATGSPMILMANGVLGLLLVLVFLASVIPIAVWIFRAHANLAEAKLAGLQYAPGWVTGSYFIPIVNFVVPFLGMRELYNRSMGEPEDFANSSVGDVTSWWSCHVAGVLVYCFVTFTQIINAVPGVYLTTPFWANIGLSVLAMVLLAGSGWFLQKIIADVTEAQQSVVNIEETFA